MSKIHSPDAMPPQQFQPIHNKTRNSRRVRLLAQIVALALFLYLLLGTTREFSTFLPHDLFFIIDPLAAIAAMIAGRVWIIPMAIGGLVLLFISFAFGRVWCSWLCPLGTIIDLVPSRRVSKQNLDIANFWRQGKNLTLSLVFFGALLGTLTLIVLDPITLLFRSLAAGVFPLLSSTLLVADKWLYGINVIQPGVAWVDTTIRIQLLGETGFYLPNLILLVFFLTILALNVIRPRAWCRYFCPLGGLLGLVSRLSWIRHRVDLKECTSCERCAMVCHTGAINPRLNFSVNQSECTTCLDCVDTCPTHAISFSSNGRKRIEYQPERRQFLASLMLALAAILVLRFIPSPSRSSPRFVRPPGATEESLEKKCIRCGECTKVCPTGAIQPINSSNAWESTWAPHLQLRRGYCDYSCNACGQVCPTGAINELSLDEKRKYVIGMAFIDKKRCIPFAEEKECIVCEEMCPLPKKAIVLKRGEGVAARPFIDEEICNGCGICEHQCPLKGESAIRIFTSLARAQGKQSS